MRGTAELIKRAVSELKGHRPEVGAICGTEDDPIAKELVRYEDNGETCVLKLEGVETRQPVSEVFDVNMVNNRCHEMHLGEFQRFKASADAN